MAKMVLLAAYLSINANLLHSNANKIELTVEVEVKEVTTYTSLGWKEVLGGLKSAGLGVEFKQDYAAAALDSIMWPLLGTVVPFECRADQAAVGAGNPKYTGNILIKEWKPLMGAVGDDASASVDFPTSGAVTRATS